MFSEPRKLHLIEDVLQLKNEKTLLALENVISVAKQSKKTLLGYGIKICSINRKGN